MIDWIEIAIEARCDDVCACASFVWSFCVTKYNFYKLFLYLRCGDVFQ